MHGYKCLRTYEYITVCNCKKNKKTIQSLDNLSGGPQYASMLNCVHWFVRLQYDYGHQHTHHILLYHSPDTIMRNSCHLIFLFVYT